jgi:glycosyltransferase involved in cell wall biosynthesis
MQSKDIIVYCSVVPHNYPPLVFYNTAQLLSKTHHVIFIDLPGAPQTVGLRGSLKYVRWFFSVLQKNHNFLLWNFSHQWSAALLSLYLHILKRFFDYRIVLHTYSPSFYSFYKDIPFDISCYDCADKFYSAEFVENAQRIKNFDIVFTSTQLMTTEMKKITQKVQKISCGYYEGPQFTSSSQTSKIAKSIIFSGGISHRIDYPLLLELVTQLSDYKFFFMGEVYLQKYYVDKKVDKICMKLWRKIAALPNVTYLGAFSSEESKQRLSQFEIGLIPYNVADEMTYHSHPIKIYEYLSAGLPVISTKIPSLLEYANRVPISFIEHGRKVQNFTKDFSSISGVKKNKSLHGILNKQSNQTKVNQVTAWLQQMQ